MADVLNRTTKQHLRSVNTPDYSEVNWIINPDLSAVAGFASKYWTISGDDVLLMDQAARDAVDAAEAAAQVVADKIAEKLRYAGERALRAIVLMLIDENNIMREAITTLSTQANAVAGSIDIQDLSDRTPAQAKTAFENKVDAG